MRMFSADRDAWSPARCNSWREIHPVAPLLAQHLPPAQFQCPFHPPAPANSASPPPTWFSSSTCEPRRWINPPRWIARHRCPPTRGRTGAAPRAVRHLEFQCAASAATLLLFLAPLFWPVLGPLITSTRSSPPRDSVIG